MRQQMEDRGSSGRGKPINEHKSNIKKKMRQVQWILCRNRPVWWNGGDSVIIIVAETRDRSLRFS